MGITKVKANIFNPAHPTKKVVLEFLVDSGAAYSVAPRTQLKKLGIKAESTESFFLANGEEITREIGNALFEYRGHRRASPVIFGEEGDSNLLGVVTLEALGFVLDPLRRELKPMPMLLM
ncbi:MAG: aspartyl protease [Chloroflexota bacterium]